MINGLDDYINRMHTIIDDLEKKVYEYINSNVNKKTRNLEDYIPGAPKFQYIEFIRSNTAKRYNLSNEPNELQWQNIETLAVNILQPLRDKFGGLRINSGFRSKEVNKKVGGSETSFHCFGMAADIIPLRKGVTNRDLLEYTYNNLNFTEMIYEFPPNGWVHVALDINNINKELRLKDNNHDYEDVSLNYILTGDYKRR